MNDKSRLPQLAYPFAVTGAAAGWLAAGLLASPLLQLTVPGQQGRAAAVAAPVGALVGWALSRWCVADGVSFVRLRLAASVLVGGAVTGAAVGLMAFANPIAMASGALNGLLSSLAVIPICGVVLAAARRATRARLGSIVAGADRRAVWGILASALAAATLAALPDWPASRVWEARRPDVALLIAVAAGLVVLVVLGADALALRRLARAASGVEPFDPEAIDAGGDPVPSLDLGLGDGVLGRVARGPAAYRARDRAVALLLGSPDEARAALRRAVLRGVAGLAMVGLVLYGHALAFGPPGQRVYHEARCEQGAMGSCPRAASLLLGEPGGGGRALVLYERACETGLGESCAAIADALERGEAVPRDARRAAGARLHACDRGHGASCRMVAHGAVAQGWDRVRPFLEIGCRWGDAASCTELRAGP
jgi:hypothetical protein